MNTIIQREVKNYMKNPLYWVGLLIVFAGMYSSLKPYLQIEYAQSQEQIDSQRDVMISDADVMDGYIPVPEEVYMEKGYAEIERLLSEEFEMTDSQVREIMDEIKELDDSIAEISEYLEKKYRFYSADYLFEDLMYGQGTPAEINAYIGENLERHSYSYYFGRKFADFGGLFMAFFSSVMLAFLFLQDTKNDQYELLHTKPVSASGYIGGKAIGGLAAMGIGLFLLTVLFGSLCQIHGSQAGFPVAFTDIWAAAVCFIVPNMLLTVSIYTCISMAFQTPLPAVPLLILWIIYSNMGSVNADGMFGYHGRILAVMVRFPGRFFDPALPAYAVLNQIVLILFSGLLLGAAVVIWKKRRSG